MAHTKRVQVGGVGGCCVWLPHTEFPAGRELTYKAIITLSEKPCSIPFAFQSRNKKCGLFIFVFCFCVGFYFFVVLFFFLVQHNLERLKAFQPKCGEKTGKALFLHKTSIPK